MKRVSLAVVLAVLAAGCGSSSNAPSNPANPTFTAQLLPSQETPPITGPESVVSGSVTITFANTPPTGTVTSAVGCCWSTVSRPANFPAGSQVILAHIHTGDAGVKGAVLVPFIPSGAPLAVTGSGSFTQTANISGSDATNIMANPGGFYFNVHTALNGGGVMRGQLVRTQ